MTKCRFSKLAEKNLKDVVSAIAEEDKNAADSLLKDFRVLFDKLAIMPAEGYECEGAAPEFIKFYPERSYVVVYKPKPTEIIHILGWVWDSNWPWLGR